jgi:hypothetical protein
MLELLEKLTAQRAADAAPRRQRRPALDVAAYAGLSHEESVQKLARTFEEIIRARRLEMLGRQ